MKSGPDVDIMTGRPKGESDGKKRERLYDRTEWIGIDDSVAASRLRNMIEKLLIEHIMTLINNDPRSDAYLSILREMGYRKNIAERAADALMNPRGSNIR